MTSFPCDLVSEDGERHPHAAYVAYLSPNCCGAEPRPHLMCSGCAAAVRGDLSTASIQCHACHLRARTVLRHLTDLRIMSATAARTRVQWEAGDVRGPYPHPVASEAADMLAAELLRLHDEGWEFLGRRLDDVTEPGFDGQRVTASAAMCRRPDRAADGLHLLDS